MKFKRFLELGLPAGQSAFLWGARRTGKSTYLQMHYPDSIVYDLLNTDVMTPLLRAPHILREELLAVPSDKLVYPVIIYEIQKIPALLDEIHWLIEHKNMGFILCGSSARKLKRGAANLLGGRAWGFNFYPLVTVEIPNFDLMKALSHGLLPVHYLSQSIKRDMRAYINEYIKEEIQAEGLVRNLPGFARFLDIVGFSSGEMINYANISRECHIDAKSVKEYFQILVDTLMGYHVYPFAKKISRELIAATPKFYLFDVGIYNHLCHRDIQTLKGPEVGKAFEHFILMELKAYCGLNELDIPLEYWRSKSGLEVDFVLDRGRYAIEVKISEYPELADLKGLKAFCEDYQPEKAIVVCQAPRRRKIVTDSGYEIIVMPWQEFCELLWLKQLFDV